MALLAVGLAEILDTGLPQRCAALDRQAAAADLEGIPSASPARVA